MIRDYVCYVDTDSLYIDINDFCREHLGKAFWTNKTDDEKIDIIGKILIIVVHFTQKYHRDCFGYYIQI